MQLALTDKTSDERFEKTVFVVEATSFEQQALWAKNEKTKRLDWVQENHGILATAGYIGDRSICFSCQWVKLNGHYVLFWHATSQLVDHKMIEEWFEKNCDPTWENGLRKAKSDAQNFHMAIHCVEALNQKSEMPCWPVGAPS